MKDSQRINNLTFCSQVALFGMSYSPLLIIICAKILYSKSEYLHWGGFNLDLGYGLYEIEYEEESSNYTVIVIAQNKYLLEGDEIDVYPIGRKLYYSQDDSKIN